jgi:hypothetical protein
LLPDIYPVVVVLSIHPSFSFWKKKMMEKEDNDEWRQQFLTVK